jgi:hypothetical protein
MRNSNKAMMAMAAGVGLGYMAAKKQFDNKKSYRKFLEKLEDYLD